MQNNNLGLTFVIGQLVENSIQAKATGTSNDEDGNANLLAAVALTNMYINSNINNTSYIEAQFDMMLINVMQELNSESTIGYDIYIASIGAILETTKNVNMYKQFYDKVLLMILNEDEHYNGFTQVVDTTLKLCRNNTFCNILYPQIIEECIRCLTISNENNNDSNNNNNNISIEKKVNVFEEISNLIEILNSNDKGQYTVLISKLIQTAKDTLNGSTNIAKLSLRVLNKIQILNMNTSSSSDNNTNNSDQATSAYAQDIWVIIMEFYTSTNVERKNFAYIIWSVLFQLLPDAWKEEKAWEMITFGLNSTDTLLSKRAYSLLRRLVDIVATNTKLNEWLMASSGTTPSSNGNNSTHSNNNDESKKKKKRKRKKKGSIDFGSTPLETWKIRFSIFGSIFECLDGIQGHLVEAVWPQFAQLCAIAKYDDSNQSLPYNFMLCDHRFISILLKKSWRNTNPSIKHWTVSAFLKFPPIKGKHWVVDEDTITIDMLEAINSPNYFRRHIKGIEEDLLNFLLKYVNMLESDEKRRIFLQRYIKYSSIITRNDFPLAAQMKLFTHLMDANVIVQGVVGENEVKYMRDNFTKKHLGSALSRKIITESSINAIVYFSTPGSVPISALGNFFVNVQSTILQPKSTLHKKLQNWIKEDWNLSKCNKKNDVNDTITTSMKQMNNYMINDDSDGKQIFDNLYSNKLNKYVYNITSYKNVNDNKADNNVENEMDPQTLAYMLSLVPDIEHRIKMITPVFKILNNSYTHSYIPKKTLLGLFELFVGICSTTSPLTDDNDDNSWNYKFISDMLGNNGRGELLSYIEHGFDVYLNILFASTDQRNYSVHIDDNNDNSEEANNNDNNNRVLIPMVLGQLLKICPSDERISTLALKFIEKILSKIENLIGDSLMFAIKILDEVLLNLLHPTSNSKNDTQDFNYNSNEYINKKFDKIVSVIGELSYKSDPTSNKTMASKQLEVNVTSEFHACKWNMLSTIFAYIDNYNTINKKNASSLVIEKQTVLVIVEIAKDAFEGATTTYFLPLLETVVSIFPQWHDIVVSNGGGDGTSVNVEDYLKNVNPLFKSAWVAFSEVDRNRLSSELVDTLCMLLFHEKFMHAVELHEDSSNCIAKDYIHKLTSLIKGGNANKRIMHGFAKQIFKIFSNEISGEKVAKLYVSEMAELILYEEPLEEHLHQEEKNVLINDVHRGRLKYTLFHAHVMSFLDYMVDQCVKQRDIHGNNDKFNESFIYKLTIHLLDMNFLEDWRFENYMPNSPAHAMKLRVWQCLCVLARSTVPGNVTVEYVERVSKVLDENHLPSIRYYAEIFLARCLVCDPLLNVSKYLLSRYNTFNIRTPTLVSLLFSTTYILPHLIKRSVGEEEEDNRYNKVLYEIMLSLYPWMGGSNGQARVIAQHIVATIVHFNAENTSKSAVYEVTQEKHEFLNHFYKYLVTNTDVARMIKRQVKNLTKVDIYKICSLNGMMEGQLNMWGNIFPPDILQILKDTITVCNEEAIEEDHYMYTWVAATARVSQKGKNRKERADEAVRLVKETMYNNNNNNNDENDEEENRIRPFEFQRKILPWGDLDTAVEDMLLSNNQNSQQISSRKTRKEFALSRRKQEIIVIASLVDKVPNLAGLTRTCEIFGAKKLVIPSKKFQDDDLFSTISVTAEKWLNIEYVPELDLKDYLLSCKKDGYTLVGLEQTSNSKSIENYNFQRKTAILLGKEQEGIPPEFIDMLEDCVEIPQFGIVRSLNVHVSGSILLWEYTRQGLVNKND